jgi:hypothetical protein
VEAVPEWATQCHRIDTGLTAHSRTLLGMASQGGLVKQHRDMIVRGPALRGFTFDPSARVASEYLILWSGERTRGPRAWGGLERGGDSPEGASNPRARRRFARGGVQRGQPSSEAKIRGAAPGPRARRRFEVAALGPRARRRFEVQSPTLERDGSSPEGALRLSA